MSTALQVRVDSLVTGLASCLCAELEVAEAESGVTKPCMCTVLPGALVAIDYALDGGMAWTRLAGIAPIEIQSGRTCVLEYDVTVEMGIMRCAPTLGEEGELPGEAEQLASAMLQNFDMGIMHKALTCCTVPASFSFSSMGPYTPIGPDGGAVGGTWTRTWRTA